MKKPILGILFIASILSTGCLGNIPDQIVGTWEYEKLASTQSSHQMRFTFDESGKVIINDITDTILDTGSYELYISGTHRILNISNTDIKDPIFEVDVEWIIVNMDSKNMAIGTKEHGGFIQKDLNKL